MKRVYSPMGKDGTAFPAFRPEAPVAGFPASISLLTTQTASIPESGVLGFYAPQTHVFVNVESDLTTGGVGYRLGEWHFVAGNPGEVVRFRGSIIGSRDLYVWEMSAR